MTTEINKACMKLTRRAERNDPAILQETFVDVGPLMTILGSEDNQILYGRRGTGKTHALRYLLSQLESRRTELGIYIDMRTLGSNISIYLDNTRPLSDRGSALLKDTLECIYTELQDYVINEDVAGDSLRLLDEFIDQITEVKVLGETTSTTSESSTESQAAQVSLDLNLSGAPSADVRGGLNRSSDETKSRTLNEIGAAIHRVSFTGISKTLSALIHALGLDRVWIVLDEWSAVPGELQPFLADLLRRAMLPLSNLTLKIAAIEQRSNFIVRYRAGDYLGIELGADVAADVDLDDYMVFGNDRAKAEEFFAQLLARHVKQARREAEPDEDLSADALLQTAFKQQPVFSEFVRAAEGVPRDAMNVLSLAAQKADDEKISMDDVRKSARSWYLRDKEKNLSDEEKRLLHYIIDEVIAHRQAKAFLLEQSVARQTEIIGNLVDSRVLHLVKQGISSPDYVGVRFNAYALDFGCYVDLMLTKKAPKGLFQVNEDDWVEVPQDDYRSIRSAILEFSKFVQDEDQPRRLLTLPGPKVPER